VGGGEGGEEEGGGGRVGESIGEREGTRDVEWGCGGGKGEDLAQR